ncbi:MAG: NAD-dependent protein deacetylase [Pseudomonadota bacterium]
MIDTLAQWVAAHPRLFVLTGAGISAGSGIPTYRDSAGVWRSHKPIQHQEFMRDSAARRRYWARSMGGWPPVARARPNGAHLALAELESMGRIEMLVTQNVDRLHQRAGSRTVIDLHGRLDRVQCLNCGQYTTRHAMQRDLMLANPALKTTKGPLRPDGDADTGVDLDSFEVPPCRYCGGTLKPDVVFFGGNVPRPRVQNALDALASSDALLAVGSSLQVFSGYRFCRRADELGLPIAIINPGQTRADPLASLHVHAECEPVLSELVLKLRATPVARRSRSPELLLQPGR